MVDITENKKELKVTLENGDILTYEKPFNNYDCDYYNLVKILIDNDIYKFDIGIKYCYVYEHKEKYEKLKSIFSIKEIDDCKCIIELTDEKYKKCENKIIEIVEYDRYINAFLENETYNYSILPRFDYDFLNINFCNIVKIFLEHDIYIFRLYPRKCFVYAIEKKYEKLKKIFNVESIDDCCCHVVLQNDEEYEKWKIKWKIKMDNKIRSEKLKRIIHDND